MNLKSRLKEVFTSGDTYTVLTLLKALIDEMDGIEFATPENIAELHEDFDELQGQVTELQGDVDELGPRVQALEGDVAALEPSVESLSTQVQALSNKHVYRHDIQLIFSNSDITAAGAPEGVACRISVVSDRESSYTALSQVPIRSYANNLIAWNVSSGYTKGFIMIFDSGTTFRFMDLDGTSTGVFGASTFTDTVTQII